MKLRIPSVEGMGADILTKHLSLRHERDLAMNFRDGYVIRSPLWRPYHDLMHRWFPERYDHVHVEAE